MEVKNSPSKYVELKNRNVFTPAISSNNCSDTKESADPDSPFGSGKGVSFLQSDAVLWMNKRRPLDRNNKGTRRAYVMPSRALQLREIFRGLDFDKKDAIDIDEMKLAIKYVAKASLAAGETPLFEDPDKIINFFVSMDANGDGTIDFNEFLVGMTETSNNDMFTPDHIQRLNQAFFDFVNHHRRQRIIDFVRTSNTDDVAKYHELRQLFSIKYFKDETVDLSMNEQLQRRISEVKSQQKELNSVKFAQQKRREQMRAREAALYFQSKCFGQQIAGRQITGPGSAASMTNAEYAATVAASQLHCSIEEAETLVEQIDKKIRKKFAVFSLHDQNTFAPAEDGIESISSQGVCLKPVHIKRKAKEEASSVKLNKYLVSNLPSIAPPLSVRAKGKSFGSMYSSQL